MIAWKRHDTTPLRVALERLANGAYGAQSLAGATVVCHLRDEATGATVVSAGACVVADAANGVVTYDWAAGGNSQPGLYRLEFEVTYGDGTRETFPRAGYAMLEVQEDLG